MDMDMPFAEFAEKHLKSPEGSKSAVERLVKPQCGKWVMHIIGPDDVIEYPDELTALREANKLNKALIEAMAERHPNDPVILAVAKNAAVEEV